MGTDNDRPSDVPEWTPQMEAWAVAQDMAAQERAAWCGNDAARTRTIQFVIVKPSENPEEPSMLLAAVHDLRGVYDRVRRNWRAWATATGHRGAPYPVLPTATRRRPPGGLPGLPAAAPW